MPNIKNDITHTHTQTHTHIFAVKNLCLDMLQIGTKADVSAGVLCLVRAHSALNRQLAAVPSDYEHTTNRSRLQLNAVQLSTWTHVILGVDVQQSLTYSRSYICPEVWYHVHGRKAQGWHKVGFHPGNGCQWQGHCSHCQRACASF